MRGYPSEPVLPILSNLADSTMSVGIIEHLYFCYPNHQNVRYEVEKDCLWKIPTANASRAEFKKWEMMVPVNGKLKVPYVFMTNSTCQSFGESIMEIVKHYRLGKIVGEPTCGTNGDVFMNMQPTIGYVVTSYRFRNHDGSQHHGIGVLPDVSVAPTVKGIYEGRDEVLEKAVEILKSR